MPKTKSRQQSVRLSPVPSPGSNRPEPRALSFLNRYSALLSILVVAIGAARIVATYNQLSVTVDEPGHFACGLQYLSQHVYRYESQHPPLSRAMAALVPYLAGARILDNEPKQGREGFKILVHSKDPDRLVTQMRVGELPFFLLGSLVVFLWARDSFGGATAFAGVFIYALTPQILADAGLSTTDMALAACLAAAFYALIRWSRSPSWPNTVLLGFAAALAALSKFTALAFLPAAVLLSFGGYLFIHRPGLRKLVALARMRAPRFAAAVGIGALLIWAAYFFSFGRVPVWNIALPAPEFFDGIRVAANHTSSGHNAYLFGKFSKTGWWYYFPVALAVKTPIGLILLVAAGLAFLWKCRRDGSYLPLAFSLGVLLPSMAGHVNIGLRHVLPMYLGFAVLAGMAVVQLARAGVWLFTIVAVPALAWLALAGIQAHPDYLAYFNGFSGDRPEEILLDSNFDWGQNLKLLARRLHEWNVHEIHQHGLDIGNELFPNWYGLPPIVPSNDYNPAIPDPGWTVVSLSGLKYSPPQTLNGSTNTFEPIVPWYYRTLPAERVGGYLLFHIVPGQTPGS